MCPFTMPFGKRETSRRGVKICCRSSPCTIMAYSQPCPKSTALPSWWYCSRSTFHASGCSGMSMGIVSVILK